MPGAAALPLRSRGRPRTAGLDDGIMSAAAQLVAEKGFGGLTMDGVARRAGVAKATVYRRYPTRIDLIVALGHAAAPHPAEAPDTGELRSDLIAVLSGVVDALTHSDTGRLLPAMLAEAIDNDEVREALRRFSGERRRVLGQVLRRAVDRGELAAGTDLELLGDRLVGPLVYRHLITGRSLGRQVVTELVDATMAGS